ncbi:MAG TPA: alpha/beta hydrolase [Candidatus Sulfotelmatobacter sp.]|nr:alpha/beta hydrolase [Candidatus Sulfotelmatobacter sp.]
MSAAVKGVSFTREERRVNGVKVAMLTAGQGEPLVFLHGAGTFHGFDFALPWAEQHKVIIPFHPGFGESADDPAITGMHDYVMHYVELLDQLGLAKVNLVGFSLGGWMAAAFAMEHGHRVRKLVLVAPAGLKVAEHPMVDIFRIPGEELPGYLVADINVILPHLPKGPDIDFIVDRYREMTTVARIVWEKPFDRTLPRWLHRLGKVPTMILWGEKDRLIPVGQAGAWQRLIPNSSLHTEANAGHLVLDESPAAVRAVGKFLS